MKRDTDYYLGRMQAEKPAIYADFLAGRYASANEAIIAAGLRKPKDVVGEAKQLWKRMNDRERSAFVIWLKSSVRARAVVTAPSLITADRRLTPQAKKRVQSLMGKRRLKLGDVMKEMGLNASDASLGGALARGTRVSPAVAAHLDSWAQRQP
jgi:hypothetical protein